MHRLFLPPALLGMGFMAAHAGSPANFKLFTAEEAATWNSPGAKHIPKERGVPVPGVPNCHAIPANAGSAHDPKIDIVKPEMDKALSAPIDIDVKFVPGAAAIKPDTFKVCYVGFLVMDITKRVTDHVAVTAEGLHVAGADLPKGHHHLVMMIADQQGAIGSRDAVFEIQ